MDALDTLTTINLDDLVNSFGWQNYPLPAAWLRRSFHAPAHKFARQMVEFDDAVGASDLPSGARRAIGHYVESVRIFGAEHRPASGPALFLANHPGLADTLALFCALNRPDLRIIALDRPFLQALPNTTRHLFYISENPAERISAVKKTAAHLKNGGAVLTFPAGQIEPDPNVYPGALEALANWTDSAGVFVRFAPQTCLVPTFVRGVLGQRAVKHPLTRLKAAGAERERLGAAFQLLAHLVFNWRAIHITVQFGPPITVAQVGSTDPAALHAALLERMRALIQNPPTGEGISAL